MLEHVYLIPLIPLAASMVILFGGKEGPHSKMPFVGIAAMGWCLIQSIGALYGLHHLGGHPYTRDWTWFSFAADMGGKSFVLDMLAGVHIDGPAAIMLVVVTLVSLLVQIYSTAYMHDDPRFKRYYAYLSFFTASMLGLIVSSNLLITFACWELVGVSSYLLIGFWFEKPGPAYACKKAFMTTKLGDSGFYIALLLIFATVGSFQITRLEDFVARGYMPATTATLIGLGLLAGAAGKSAQWPLFIWLPDAMEGPTPVSALIHAATMVAAGIYLVARCYCVFVAAPMAMEAVAWIGLITAVMAATMALVAYDIKRVLAFSTVSQLGFMLCALGVGGYTAGLFHLTTHAFFKALLFLGAGSVIHAVHTNDMRQMGGLSRQMPWTFWTMLVATLAISGIPGTSGYYSKDLILEVVFEHSKPMFALLVFAASLTAFYMTRLMMLTFIGDARDSERHRHAHESPAPMLGPLFLLGALSLVSGALLEHGHFFQHLVHYKLPAAGLLYSDGNHADPKLLARGMTVMAVFSMSLAVWLYKGPSFAVAEAVKSRCSWVFAALENRYGFDAVFLWLVAVSDKVASACFWVDKEIVDAIFVDGWGLLTRIAAEISHLFDALFIDRSVDGFGDLTLDLGGALRSLVTRGQVQEYLMYIAITVSLFASLALGR